MTYQLYFLVFVQFLLTYPLLANSTLCSTLYSKQKLQGNSRELIDGDRLDDLKYAQDLKQTTSLTVERRCSLQICKEPHFSGTCQTFEHGSHAVAVSDRASMECKCTEVLGGCKCSRHFVKKSICGRAFLGGGCRACDVKHVDLKMKRTEIPEVFVDKVEAIMLRKGCVLNIYSEPDFNGKHRIISDEIVENFKGSIGSYQCKCNDDLFRERVPAPRPRYYPDLINVPSTFDEVLKMLNTKQHMNHEGLLAAYQSFTKGRSTKNAYILLLGSSGSGKSSTINTLFDNPKVTIVGDGSSITNNVHEFRITVPIDELGVANSELRVIDTPGLGDTRGMLYDAQILTSLESYLSTHEELKDRIPNVVLIVHRFDDNRFSGEGSNFVKMLRGFDSIRRRITDQTFSNVIFVLTHFCSVPKANQRQPLDRLLKFKKAIQDYTLFPRPINIVVAENKGFEEELAMLNGYWQLANGDLYPRNLFENLELVTEHSGDIIGLGVFRSAFRNSDDFKITQKSFELVNKNHENISRYLDILNNANMIVEQTEISNILSKIWEEKVSDDLRRKFPHSLAYLQTLLNLRNINDQKDIPRTNTGIMKLLADIKLDEATRILLEKGLGISVPIFRESIIVGNGYDVFNDAPLSTSPFKSDSLQESDIGFLIPDYLSCSLKPDTIDRFLTSDNKNEYVRQRMNDLGIDVDGSVPTNKFSDVIKPGYNIENLSFNAKNCKASAVRSFKLFELSMTDRFELTEEFKSAVESLKQLDESDITSVENWKGFFAKYGTHIVRSAYGGGLIEIRLNGDSTCNKEELYKLIGILKFVEDISLSFTVKNKIPDGKVFPVVEGHSLKFLGGDYNHYTNDLTKMQVSESIKLLLDWKDSLRFNPIMLSSDVTLVPISHIAKQLGGKYSIEIETATNLLFRSKLKYTPPMKQPESTALAREDTPHIDTSEIKEYIMGVAKKLVRQWILSYIGIFV